MEDDGDDDDDDCDPILILIMKMILMIVMMTTNMFNVLEVDEPNRSLGSQATETGMMRIRVLVMSRKR